MSVRMLLRNFKRTWTISKTMGLALSLWAAFALAGVVLAICTAATEPLTFVSSLAVGWMGGAIYLIATILRELLLDMDYLKGVSGATRTTATRRREYQPPPVAKLELPKPEQPYDSRPDPYLGRTISGDMM